MFSLSIQLCQHRHHCTSNGLQLETRTMNWTMIFPFAGILTLAGGVTVWHQVYKAQGAGRDTTTSWLIAIQTLATVLNLVGVIAMGPITETGIHFTIAESAATATLFVQVMFLVGLIRHGIQGLGLFLLPVVALPLLLMPWIPDDGMGQGIHTTSLLQTGHLMISMLAYAVLTMTTFYAIMHLILDLALKRKRIHPVVQAMPSLIELEGLIYTLLKWSVTLIGISILSGLIWQWVDFSSFELLNHKVLLSFFSFMLLFWITWKNKQAAWHGVLSSKIIVTSYILLLLAYFGVRLIHSWLN